MKHKLSKYIVVSELIVRDMCLTILTSLLLLKIEDYTNATNEKLDLLEEANFIIHSEYNELKQI